MDWFFGFLSKYVSQLTNELGQIAMKLDGNGWIIVSGILLVTGWCFLKGNKIRAV
ncbi:MAG: hypothetical protein ACI814_001158 [Mariniblastus sp.]|jgi:hypothetical protein